MFRFTAIVIIAIFAQPVWSMASAGPRALHVLIKMADVVAVVHVTERFEVDSGEDHVKARLDQVIYGDVQQGQVIDIGEFDLMGCAGPVAEYKVGQRLLVLLSGNQKKGYLACGNLYGARVLDDEQQAQCIKRIEEFYRIREVHDEQKRKLLWTEWAVRCAEQPSTLADGLALLGRGTDLELGADPIPGEPAWYFPLLNLDQKGRLLKRLKDALESDRISEDFGVLMRVIAHANHDEALLEIAFDAEKELRLPVAIQNHRAVNEFLRNGSIAGSSRPD